MGPVCLRLLQVSSPVLAGAVTARGAPRGARTARRRRRRRRRRATYRRRWRRIVVPDCTVRRDMPPVATTITRASAAAVVWRITIAVTIARDVVRVTKTRISWNGICYTSAAKRRPSVARTAPSAPSTSAISRRISIIGTSICNPPCPASPSVSEKRVISTAGSDSSWFARSRRKTGMDSRWSWDKTGYDLWLKLGIHSERVPKLKSQSWFTSRWTNNWRMENCDNSAPSHKYCANPHDKLPQALSFC